MCELTKTELSKALLFYAITITYHTIRQILHFSHKVELVLTKKLLFLIYSFIIALKYLTGRVALRIVCVSPIYRLVYYAICKDISKSKGVFRSSLSNRGNTGLAIYLFEPFAYWYGKFDNND